MQTGKPAGIVRKLCASGHEAYYVGGCVRDQILNRPIHDWDITTSALPREILACFPHCVETGIRHGTVTVLDDSGQAEVTTYRTDGNYLDGRHPEQVVFVRSLAEDLARRDFTINAMAMDEQGRIVDLYGGQDDLNKRCIRCVGSPMVRFREDALRMFRALRFSAQLNFTIESETLEAIRLCAPLCSCVSVERIRDEMEKTLLSDHPERIVQMVELGLLEGRMPACRDDLRWIASLPRDREVRWAALCRSCPEADLQRLRLDKRTARNAMESAGLPVPQNRLGWKRLVAEQGSRKAEILAALEHREGEFAQIQASGECMSLRELAVNGSDFPHVQGKELGKLLHKLLDHVLEHPEDNQKEILRNI